MCEGVRFGFSTNLRLCKAPSECLVAAQSDAPSGPLSHHHSLPQCTGHLWEYTHSAINQGTTWNNQTCLNNTLVLLSLTCCIQEDLLTNSLQTFMIQSKIAWLLPTDFTQLHRSRERKMCFLFVYSGVITQFHGKWPPLCVSIHMCSPLRTATHYEKAKDICILSIVWVSNNSIPLSPGNIWS